MSYNQKYLTVKDFDNVLKNYAGRTVSHTPRTSTISNRTGKRTNTDGTTTMIKCFFRKINQTWTFDKAGKIEGGDAVLLSKYADGVTKNDLIEADGEKYIVHDAVDVPGTFNYSGDPTFVYTYCNLFKYEE